MRRHNKRGPVKKKYQFLIGNKNARKIFPHNARIDLRFNDQLKYQAQVKADQLDLSLADYIERLVRKDLYN